MPEGNGKPRSEIRSVETVTWKVEVIEVPPPLISKELKKHCSHFIQEVYETDPLICPPASHRAAVFFCTVGAKIHAEMQLNSSLFSSWLSSASQAQAQNDFGPKKN